MPSLLHIHIAPEHGAALRPLEEIRAVKDQGLEGDRNFGIPNNRRQVTLVASGELAKAEAEWGHPIPSGATRRNLTVEIDTLPRLPGARIRIGEVLLEVDRDCAPCSNMETAVGIGARQALAGRAGVTARVVEGGVLRVGDEVAVEV